MNVLKKLYVYCYRTFTDNLQQTTFYVESLGRNCFQINLRIEEFLRTKGKIERMF